MKDGYLSIDFMDREKWKDNANCAGIDTEEFFQDGPGNQYDPRLLTICNNCYVRRDCLNYAIENNEEGYWAGTTPRTRQRIRSGRQKLPS